VSFGVWIRWREAVFGVVAKRETVPTVSCSVRERGALLVVKQTSM
jgi:hypothetical protein